MAAPFSSLKPVHLLLGGLVLLLLAGLGYWLDRHLQREPDYVLTEAATIVRRNRFYAAERLLTRLGSQAHSVPELNDLPAQLDGNAALVLSLPSYVLTPTRTAALLDWVAVGGHLLIGVYQTYEPGRGDDPLLDALQVKVWKADRWSETPLQLAPTPGKPALQVQFQSLYYLQAQGLEAIRQAADLQGNRLLQYSWGWGWVTVLSDLDPFTNDRLAEYDHADLLWALVGDRPAVWLQYRPRVPSLLQLLWIYAWMPLLGLLLALTAAIRTYSYRLGPLLPTRTEERRSLLEHLQAGGRFLWHHNAQAALLDAVRQRLAARLEQRWPYWQQLKPTEQIQRLAELSELSREQVSYAWQTMTAPNPREFLFVVQQLQRIDKSL
ncbi:MAG: DUF4350 domain-containing protein [Candidatus Competibacteraceae bacterium]